MYYAARPDITFSECKAIILDWLKRLGKKIKKESRQ
jgi:hypothetical protein